MDIFEGLNERQLAAVTADAGPVLVLAGPGSGKTRVLTYRVAHLINNVQAAPENIVAVTFTNKAAGEMLMRVNRLLRADLRRLRISTFHALCARLLRIEGENTPFGPNYVIYDTDDQRAAVSQAISELNLDPKRFTPARVLNKVSAAKNELVTPEEYISLDYFEEVVARVYPRYQAILLDNNALDFDDLLMQMVILLEENDAVRRKYQHRLEHVLVDEFQDTNMAQYRLVKILAEPQQSVFVVGDEDQAIYAFRGADYRNVMRFREDYPTCETILLEQNYRSTQIILDAARSIIDKNAMRTPKALFTDRGMGLAVQVKETYNEEFEARFVVETIQELAEEKNASWADFAVMYRTNVQSRALEEAFIREGIPYVLIGGVGFYKRREVRDLLAYLRLVSNPEDKISFSRIVNVPRRGIGKKTLADFQRWAANDCNGYEDAMRRLMQGEPTPLSGRAARLLADFGEMLNRWRELAAEGNLVQLFDTLITDIGFNLYLESISETSDEGIERTENVQELRGLIAEAYAEDLSLVEFLAERALVADVDSLEDSQESVTLLTLHAAKGLEFPVVFITGLEEGMLPHSRAFDEADGLAEERRLMYVGVTRAEERLYLTHTFRRSLYGNSVTNEASRFLADIPPEAVEGLSPRASAEAEVRRFREETTWHADVPAKPATRKSNKKLRDKIIPFPGGATEQKTRFKTNDRVKHKVFGPGRVLESKLEGGIELVTVVFEDRQHGIKSSLDAEYLSNIEG